MNRNHRLDERKGGRGTLPWDAHCMTVAIFGGVLLPIAQAQAPSQQHGIPSGGSPSVTQTDISGPHDEPGVSARMQEQLADRRNSERQKQLVADTEKLFALAEQLRNEVARSNKDQLSVPVVKKSEEIEKLAKAVKEKMRGY